MKVPKSQPKKPQQPTPSDPNLLMAAAIMQKMGKFNQPPPNGDQS